MTLHLVQAVRTRSGPGTDAEGLRLATHVVEAYLADGVFSTYQACFGEIVQRYEELLAGF